MKRKCNTYVNHFWCVLTNMILKFRDSLCASSSSILLDAFPHSSRLNLPPLLMAPFHPEHNFVCHT